MALLYGASGLRKVPFPAFQFLNKPRQDIQQVLFLETPPAGLPPCGREIHAAFEVCNTDRRPLMDRLHEQEFQQDALAAGGDSHAD